MRLSARSRVVPGFLRAWPTSWPAVALGLALALWLHAAAAHPLGNFAVSRYARLDFGWEAVRIAYILDFAEVPTYQLRPQLDPNGDGDLDPAETAAYLDDAVPRLM